MISLLLLFFIITHLAREPNSERDIGLAQLQIELYRATNVFAAH